MKKTSRLLSTNFPYLVLTFLGFLIYSNTFRAPFHFDDVPAIVDNPFIRNLFDIRAIWNAFNSRFIVGLSLALNYHLGKLDIFGYHLFNISVHVLNSFLVYQFCTLTFETPFLSIQKLAKWKRHIAFLMAFIFLTHPIQTQAVTYIWQRTTSLATFFYLSTLVFYAKARLRSSKFYFLISFGCAVLGMFCKEIAFTLPVAVLLYEFFFLTKNPQESRLARFYKVAPFLLLFLVIPFALLRAPQVTLGIMKPHLDSSGPFGSFDSLTRFVREDEMPRSVYLLTQPRVLRAYLRLLFFPAEQNLYYDFPLAHSFFEANTFFSFALLFCLLGVGILLFNRHRLAAFGIFLFFLTLSVESLVPQNDVIFEHRLYLPMVGYGFFVTYWISFFLAKRNPKALIVATILLTSAFGFLTYQRNFIWKDELTLWADVVQKSPGKAEGYNGRGNAYRAEGLIDQAISDYNKAIQIKPGFADAYTNRGNAYQAKGYFDQAIRDYDRAIQLQPGYAENYNNRGVAYRNQGFLDQAIADYTKAFQINPHYAAAYTNRGNAYQAKGFFDQAVSDYTKAIQIRPDLAAAYYNRSVAYQAKGSFDQTISDCSKAIEIQPDYAEAYNNRGNAYRSKGFLDQALLDYNKAIEIQPNYADARNNKLTLARNIKS